MSTVSLPPCPTETGWSCFWDATAHGGGQSYFEYGGAAVGFSVPEGQSVISVEVNSDGLNLDNPYGQQGYTVIYGSTATTTETATTTVPDSITTPIQLDFTPLLVLVGAVVLIAAIGVAAAWTFRPKENAR
jgi:hypothetical protein